MSKVTPAPCPKSEEEQQLAKLIGNPYLFEVGKTYLTTEGKAVKLVVRRTQHVGYETVMGEDKIHRYDRSTNNEDAGRCTGSAINDPRNLVRKYND